MPQPFTPPQYAAEAFHCPHCGAYAQQLWKEVGLRAPASPPMSAGSFHMGNQDQMAFTECQHCKRYAVWIDCHMAYPPESPAPFAHPDTPSDIAADYDEARDIVAQSPRGACALLRLAVQKVCIELGEPGKKLDNDIASLVKKGLSPHVQRSLDALRVIGNNAVHPGKLDLKDDTNTALALFTAMNLIVDQLIAVPKQIDALYESLPESARDAIDKRDAPTE